MYNQFKSNIQNATTLSEKLILEGAKLEIALKTIHLKADDLTRFTALFIVDKDNFLSDKFREIYVAARRLKKEAETDNFYISFSFMPFSNNLNETCLITDGFFMKYEKK